jgi:hypothetical protein
MLYSAKQITSRIKAHVKKRGGTYGAWSVGISKEPRAKLFTQHGVRKAVDFWILMHAESAKVAQEVKAYFVDKLGMVEGKGKTDAADDFVYAFRKRANAKS